MPASPETVKKVMQQYMQAWETADRALLLSLFAEDAVWEDPVGSPPFKGHAGIAKFWDFSHQGGDRTLSPETHQMIACGHEGVLRFTMRVRLSGENKGLDLHVTDYFDIDDAGKIRRARAFWDESCFSVPEGMEMYAPDISDLYEQ